MSTAHAPLQSGASLHAAQSVCAHTPAGACHTVTALQTLAAPCSVRAGSVSSACTRVCCVRSQRS